MPPVSHERVYPTASDRCMRSKEGRRSWTSAFFNGYSSFLPSSSYNGWMWSGVAARVVCKWHNPPVPFPLMPSNRGVDRYWTPYVSGRQYVSYLSIIFNGYICRSESYKVRPISKWASESQIRGCYSCSSERSRGCHFTTLRGGL